MSRTGLMFYRKTQVLDDLEKERPKSIGAVRNALRRAAEAIDDKLRVLEREFYGGATCEEDIRATLRHVRSVCTTFEVTYIHGAYQIDEMVAKQRDLDEDVKLDIYALDKLCDYHRKIRDFVPKGFTALIKDFELIVSYMEKYLLSYHNGSNDKYLETVIHYEKKRNELKDAILSHLRNITYMSRMYYDKGTPVKVFGLAVNEIARRCDCGDMPFLLIFPQCCQNIRNACLGVTKWTDADEEYAGFIACDIIDLGHKRKERLARMRSEQQGHFVMEHKLKQNKREIKQLEAELEKLAHREAENQKEVKRLESEIQLMSVDIEMLEEKREIIRSRQMHEPKTNSTKQLDRIASDISQLRYKIPATTKEINTVKSKITFITDKRALYETKKRESARFKHDVTYTKMAAIVQETELDRISNCLEVLKYIHLQKTCSASTRNIFHHKESRVQVHADKERNTQGRLLKRNLKPAPETNKDDLAKATNVVAKHIDGDWPKLYRTLPFYPPRGDKNIDHDVINITQDRLRVAEKVKAAESLDKWRRMHTRANLDDLKNTLKQMDRSDVVKRIDKSIKQKNPPNYKVLQRWRNIRTLQMVTNRISKYKSNRNNGQTEIKDTGKGKLPCIMVTNNH